jgi:hypothetical protein
MVPELGPLHSQIRLPDKIQYVLCNIWYIFKLKSSLFIWKSNLSGFLYFCLPNLPTLARLPWPLVTHCGFTAVTGRGLQRSPDLIFCFPEAWPQLPLRQLGNRVPWRPPEILPVLSVSPCIIRDFSPIPTFQNVHNSLSQNWGHLLLGFQTLEPHSLSPGTPLITDRL